jgi:hypothetical protein
MRMNAICIYLYEGEPAPVVFDTCLTGQERKSLLHWLEENPALETLVQQALDLLPGDEIRWPG